MTLRCRKCDRETNPSEDYHALLEMCESCAAEESPRSPWVFEQNSQDTIPLVPLQSQLPPPIERTIPYVTSTSSYVNENVQPETVNSCLHTLAPLPNPEEYFTALTNVIPLTTRQSEHTPRPTSSPSTYWRTGEISDIISSRTPLLTEFCRLGGKCKLQVNNIEEGLIEFANEEELFKSVKAKIVEKMKAAKCKQDAITLLQSILHDSERRCQFLRIRLKGQLATWRLNGTITAGHLGKTSYCALLRKHEKIFLVARGKVKKAVLEFSEKSVITASMTATVIHLSHRLFSTTWISLKPMV